MVPLPSTDGRKKGLPVRFSNLSIFDSSSSSSQEELVETLGSKVLQSFVDLGRSIVRSKSKGGRKTSEKKLISGVEGVVHTGELLLIIGPPTSNTPLLLRALSSPSSSDLELSADSKLDYGLLSPDVFRPPRSMFPIGGERKKRCLRGEVVFLSDRDLHFSTLSLLETLMPSSIARAPPPSCVTDLKEQSSTTSRKEFATNQIQALTSALGLGHALSTRMGSSTNSGGSLSGGERKRASVVEALISDASVLLLDSPTNGLDSSTALSLIKYLKDWATKGERSILVTSPHVADPLYEQFDKILVLNSRGHEIYFGKASTAVDYFESLGLRYKRRIGGGKQEGVAEFIVGCIEGRGSSNDSSLERAWAKSQARKNLLVELVEYESRYSYELTAMPLLDATRRSKSRYAPLSSPYSISFLHQVSILTKRQAALILSELPTYTTKTLVNLCLSLLVGTLFFSLPATTSHAFTRSSLLLLSIMFNAYLSLAELGKTIEGREIVKRQGEYGFFGASALALARVVGDLPLIGAQVLLFGTVTYFLAGLQVSLERFAIYILFIYATALNLSSMFRMFAAFSPSFEVAIRYCGVTLNILVVFAGYFIPTPSMRPWLRWIHYYADPISRSYEAVLANEFHNLLLTCSPADIVPHGPLYTDSVYQTCGLPGSTPQNLTVSGDAFLSLSYDFHYSNIWTNLLVITLQAVVFLIVGIIATDYFTFAPEGNKRIWSRTKKVLRRMRRKGSRMDVEEQERLIDAAPADDSVEGQGGLGLGTEEEVTELEIEGSVLVWRDLSLWVDTPLDTRRLLDRISGYTKPGNIVALMGASGAGKSTLLNVLAGRSEGVVKGDILVDGAAPMSQFYRTTGFVEQFDRHDDRSTVREALEFSALLRQDTEISRAEKLAYVDVVLDLLSLTHLADAIIGSPSAGLNPEQRKRLTIAVEVVSKPTILFADEPTTGLDTKSALRVVKLLRRLSRAGIAVVCTIHQPTAETFSIFDTLLLLQRGGKQVYFGPSKEALSYFSPKAIGESVNPAEFILEVAGAGVDVPDEELGEIADLDTLALRWKNSSQNRVLKAESDYLTNVELTRKPVQISSASIYQQCVVLTKRVSRNYYRDASYSFTKFFTATVVSGIIGLSFFQLDNSIVGFQNRLFSIFLILFVPPVFMNLGIFKMFLLRNLWEAREKPSKIYGRTAFVTSLILSEIPYSIACASIFFVLWYFLTGMPLELTSIAFGFALVQLFFFFQATWAMWITALAPSLGTISNLLPFFLVSMECFNGALMPYSLMPIYYKWLYWISPFQWYVRAMTSALFHDLPIECKAAELVTFQAPPAMTCLEYAGEFIVRRGGYLVNPAAEGACQFCKFATGDDYLRSLNIVYSDRWSALGVFAGYTLTNVALVFFFTFHPPRIPSFLSSGGKNRRAEKHADEVFARERIEGAEILLDSNRGAF